MSKFHVKYYYCVTGMEGRADEKDYGIIDAPSAHEAKHMVAKQTHPDASEERIRWIMSCLSATLIPE